jgi:hypothetical protein
MYAYDIKAAKPKGVTLPGAAAVEVDLSLGEIYGSASGKQFDLSPRPFFISCSLKDQVKRPLVSAP